MLTWGYRQTYFASCQCLCNFCWDSLSSSAHSCRWSMGAHVYSNSVQPAQRRWYWITRFRLQTLTISSMSPTSAPSCCRSWGSLHLLNGFRRVVCTIYCQRVPFRTPDLYTCDPIVIMTSCKERVPHCYFHCYVSRNVSSRFTLSLVSSISTLSLDRRTLLSLLCLPIVDNGQTLASDVNTSILYYYIVWLWIIPVVHCDSLRHYLVRIMIQKHYDSSC